MKVWSCYRLLNLSLCTYLHVKIVVVNLRVLVVALTKSDSKFKYCDCEYHCVYIAWVYCTGITLLKLSIIIGFLSAERIHAVAAGPFYHNTDVGYHGLGVGYHGQRIEWISRTRIPRIKDRADITDSDITDNGSKRGFHGQRKEQILRKTDIMENLLY